MTPRAQKRFPVLAGLASLAAVALACGPGKSGAPSASASASSSSVASSASAASASSAKAPAGATMPLADFCSALHQKLDAMVATCEPKPATQDLFKILKMSADEMGEDDSACGRLKNVTVVADRVPACLAEVRTHWEGGLVHIADADACRAAVVGKTPNGASCSLDLECVAGSYCVADPASKDPLASVCAPSTHVGDTCIEHRGEACGPELDCRAGHCEKRPGAGEPCSPSSQTCAPGLTCLRDAPKATRGKCGPRRSAGDVCHRWTECEGACVAPAGSEDGRCESFCGSR